MPDVSVPIQKLWGLSAASDEIMQSVLRHDRRKTFDMVAQHLGDLLDAESCSVFLVPDDDPGFLSLEAQWPNASAAASGKLRLPIQSKFRGGLTGHIALCGEVVRLTKAALEVHPYSAGSAPKHVPSGECRSLLGIPIKDRHNRVLGLLKVDNRRRVADTPAEEEGFDAVDEQIAKMFANKIVVLLDGLRTIDALGQLLQAMEAARDLDEMFGLILECGLKLLGADRGDIAWWDEGRSDLVLRSTSGRCTLPLGEAIPEKSVMRTAWAKEEGQIVGDVSDCEFYYCLDPDSRSEMTVPVFYQGRKVGVLNAESSKTTGFFDDRDRDVLELLGHHAAIAVKVYRRSAHFHERVRQLAEEIPPSKALLEGVLEDLRDVYGLDAGLIYTPDYVNRRLRCAASIGCREKVDSEPFNYSFDDTALATWVFRHRQPYYSPDPWNDPLVNRKGLEFFNIRSPIRGLPLIYGDAVVGVLVAWRTTGAGDPVGDYVTELTPLTLIAALATGVAGSAQRAWVVSSLLSHPLPTALHSVCGLVERVGELLAAGDVQTATERLSLLKQETDRLSRLSRQADSYTRLIGGIGPLKPTDLRKLVQGRLQLRREAADVKGVRLQEDFSDCLSWVLADGDKLAEAFDNLLDNAIRVSKPGESIFVRLVEAGDELLVEIEDEGPGIPEEIIQAVHDPSIGGGLGGPTVFQGLGLAIARETVAQHRGKLVYRSGRGRRGACWSVILPRRSLPGSTNGGG